MKNIAKYILILVLALVLGWSSSGMSADAANVQTGTLGTNKGVQWSYDEDTRTLTLTGKDSGLDTWDYSDSHIYKICSDVEKIILRDFEPSGSIRGLFKNLTKLQTIDTTGFNTQNVTIMSDMFYGCESLTALDVSGFDTSKVTEMYRMFSGCVSLTALDVSGFDTSKVTNMSNMFNGCESLTALDVRGFNTDNVTNMAEMFCACRSLQSLDVSGFNTVSVTSMRSMFERCESLTALDVSGFDTSNVNRMSYMFNCCRSVESLDVSGFNTSKVTSMYSMFMTCASLKSLDVSGFDTSNVNDMTQMFAYCYEVEKLDVSGFNTSKVTSMYAMFRGCTGIIELDVSHFDTSNVRKMSLMFAGCWFLKELDVSSFNTSKVTDMAAMFSGCNALTALDVSEFDTSNVTDMDSMFYGCNGLSSLDLRGFDTSNVTNMPNMFEACRQLTVLDVSRFNTANVTNMKKMFYSCRGLKSLDLSNFDTTKVTETKDMLADIDYLEMIRTPKAMASGQVLALPVTLRDLAGKEVTELKADICGVSLYKYFLEVNAPQNILQPNEKMQLVIKKNGQEQSVNLNDTCRWHSSAKDVVTVSETGEVQALKKGTATITCVIMDVSGSHEISNTVKLTVAVEMPDVITLNATEIKNWTIGRTGTFTPYVNGVKVDRVTMSWNSSNPAVATCVQGYLVGKSAGTTTISCTKEGGTVATCVVTVKPQDVITLNATEIKNWTIGRTGTFTPYVNGVKVDRTTMTWSSSNPAVATCVQGYLVGKSAGTTIINCTKANGTVATCKVTVKPQDVITLNATEIKNWTVGRTGTFTPYVNGEKVDRATMSWSSSNPAVATCIQGYLVGKGVGTTTISCTKENGTVATCKVTVKAQYEITLNATEIKNWTVGRMGTFTPYVNGEKVDRATMTWSSSNPAVATCVQGYLVGKSAGTTIISCTKMNGTVATCKVTVKDVITLNATQIKNWTVGRTGTFTPYVNGVKVDRVTMSWSSSNPEVATVVQGYLVGKSAGTTTVSCTKENGTVATCTVTVKDVVTLDKTQLTLSWGNARLEASVNGVKVNPVEMTWSSSNPEVAKITSPGLLTIGRTPGIAVISCTKEGGTVATCRVIVKDITGIWPTDV